MDYHSSLFKPKSVFVFCLFFVFCLKKKNLAKPAKFQPGLALHSYPIIPDSLAKWVGAPWGWGYRWGMLIIILHVFQTERNAKRKHNERLRSPAPHMEFRKDAGSSVESFLEGKSRVRRRVQAPPWSRSKLTCVGDGDRKQEEVQEDVLQQQDPQKFGPPHHACSSRRLIPLQEMPGWENPVASRSVLSCFYCDELSLLCD